VNQDNGVFSNQADKHNQSQDSEDVQRIVCQSERKQCPDNRQRNREHHHKRINKTVVERNHNQVNQYYGSKQGNSQRTETFTLVFHIAAPYKTYSGRPLQVFQFLLKFGGNSTCRPSYRLGLNGNRSTFIPAL